MQSAQCLIFENLHVASSSHILESWHLGLSPESITYLTLHYTYPSTVGIEARDMSANFTTVVLTLAPLIPLYCTLDHFPTMSDFVDISGQDYA